MSIDSKIAEILEESKLAGLEEELFEDEISEEEFNQLDEDEQELYELSKKTLGSYIKLASQDISADSYDAGENSGQRGNPSVKMHNKTVHDASIDKVTKRAAGIFKATDKLTKEDLDVQEDVNALLFGENLSEEFRTKATTIFEAAVISRVKEEVAQLEEEFEEKLAEQVDSITEGLVEKIDGYLDYIVEQWIEQNEIALESGIKSDIMESFITGMKGLFEEHYIDVPEEKYDVLGDMESKIDALEEKLDEAVSKNIDLRKSLSEASRKEIVKMVSEGLTDTESEKFTDLVEELSYESEDTFKTKVQTIRENYFTGKQQSIMESFVTDSPVEEEEVVNTAGMDSTVAAYVQAIKKLNK